MVAREADIPQQSSSKRAVETIRPRPSIAPVASTTDRDFDRKATPDNRRVPANEQNRIPVIIGEAHYKGMIPVDGILVGQLGKNGGGLEIRQRRKSAQPELSGEITFRDVVRINGHVAGTIYSEKGTLIVDSGAAVEADVEVAVAVIKGTVTGDIVAQERIELGMGCKVRGRLYTRSLAVDDGADFQGDCSMLADS